MATIIQTITDFIHAVLVGIPASEGVAAQPSWISTVVGTITANPLILLAVIIPFVGLGIGLLNRLFGTRA